MKIRFIDNIFSVLVLGVVTSFGAHAYSILPCTIQFPHNIAKTPMIRVYHGGAIQTCTIDQTKKSITFNVTKYPRQTKFYVLCTEMIDFASYTSKYQPSENNTASHIKLKDGQPYLLFELTLISKRENGSEYSWHINTITDKTQNHKIPDDAVIVCIPTNWIHSINSDNSFEFPTIQIKSDIFEQSGSEKAFYEHAVRLQLAAIDSDTLHGINSQQIMKQERNRIMIAAPTA